MRKPIAAFKRKTAKKLRANSTDAEQKLWRSLRNLELHGSHFRRQVPIGNFVADFACLAAKLLIEVDGSQHGSAFGAERDTERTAWLEKEGYRVLRFWNNDITGNIDGVMDAIYEALYGSGDSSSKLTHRRVPRGDHPTPAGLARRPSPSRGG
jgi:very-short-patch-repair endonuclease